MSIASQYIRAKGRKRAYGSGINVTLYADYPLPAPVITTILNTYAESRIVCTVTSLISITVA